MADGFLGNLGDYGDLTIETLYILYRGKLEDKDKVDMIDDILANAYANGEEAVLDNVAEYLDKVLFFEHNDKYAPASVAAFLKIGKLKGIEDVSVMEKSWVEKNVKLKSGDIKKIVEAFKFVRETWKYAANIWNAAKTIDNGGTLTAEQLKETFESVVDFTSTFLSTIFGKLEKVINVFADIYKDVLDKGYNIIVNHLSELTNTSIIDNVTENDSFCEEHPEIVRKLNDFKDKDPRDCGLN